MRRILFGKPYLTLVALACGIISTLAYDFVAEYHISNRVGGWIETFWMEWVLFAVALPFRLFTYCALFFSFPMLAELLRGQRQRLFHLTLAWFVTGLTLMLAIWCWMALTDSLGLGYSVKRMSPDTMAHFWPEQKLSVIALGNELAKTYTWTKAISLEVFALFTITIVVAIFMWLVAQFKVPKAAFLAPAMPVPILVLYNVYAPWSLDYDFDIFIGDALLGATLLYVETLPLSVIFGGATSSAVWIGLIAAINLLFVWTWGGQKRSQ